MLFAVDSFIDCAVDKCVGGLSVGGGVRLNASLVTFWDAESDAFQLLFTVFFVGAQLRFCLCHVNSSPPEDVFISISDYLMRGKNYRFDVTPHIPQIIIHIFGIFDH